MKRTHGIKVAACLLLAGAVCPPGRLARGGEGEANAEQLRLVAEYVSDADRETRAIGLQFVREGLPGKSATKALAALLGKLSPEAQVDLIGALGGRGDPAARAGILGMLKSDQEPVRIAALGAMGLLGSAADVPPLAGKAAAGSPRERQAARESLARLRGEGVNKEIVSAMDGAKPDVQAALLDALAARDAKEALPDVLKSARHADPAVRLAALGALRLLAGAKETAAVVTMAKGAKGATERKKAERALLALCSRGREKCVRAIVDGLADANAASRVVLLRGMARAGGAKALETIVARLKDDDEAVCDEAVRLLSSWPDASAVPCLKEIAAGKDNLLRHVLAVRGLVRLARPTKDGQADLKLLGEAMALATRPEEKGLALSALGGVASAESLALVAPVLDDPALAEEAALAAVRIAEKMKDGPKEPVRSAMEKVIKRAKAQAIRDRAGKVLKAL